MVNGKRFSLLVLLSWVVLAGLLNVYIIGTGVWR